MAAKWSKIFVIIIFITILCVGCNKENSSTTQPSITISKNLSEIYQSITQSSSSQIISIEENNGKMDKYIFSEIEIGNISYYL